MTATLAAPAPAPVVALVEPGLEARLAAADAEMTTRLQTAGLAVDVNTAHLPDIDWTDHITGPVAPPPAPEATPVAGLLHRARLRILRDGWCRDAARNDAGGMCLTEAIRAEARSHAEEGEARILLRRALGGDSIPEQNRRLPDAAAAAGVLASAAAMAVQQGL